MKQLIFIIILFSAVSLAAPAPHECNEIEFPDCEFRGKTEFKACYPDEPEAGHSMWERLHYDNPTWTFEQIDEIITKKLGPQTELQNL